MGSSGQRFRQLMAESLGTLLLLLWHTRMGILTRLVARHSVLPACANDAVGQ
jgi:hypothetical protein